MGTWKNYLSFLNATKVAMSEDKVFCVTEGGLFYFDITDNSVNKLADYADLSDFGINTIAYSRENNLLLVAYKNSNIDLIYNSGISNLSDSFRNSLIVTSPTFGHFCVYL